MATDDSSPSLLQRLLLAAGLVFLVGVGVTLSGTETRTQLCPQTLEVRRVRELKLVGYPVRTTAELANPGFAAWLQARGYVAPGTTGTWVTGQVRLIGGGCGIGPARHLAYPLAQPDQDWVAWSEAHPALADALWPRVALLARAEHYALAGELAEEVWLAAEGGDPDQVVLAALEDHPASKAARELSASAATGASSE